MASCTCGRGMKGVACRRHPDPPAAPLIPTSGVAVVATQPPLPLLGGYLLEVTRSAALRSITIRHKGGGTLDWCVKTSLDDGTRIYYYGYARSFAECLEAADKAIYSGNWRYDKQ